MTAMRQLYNVSSLRHAFFSPVLSSRVLAPAATTATARATACRCQCQPQQRRNFSSAIGETKFDQTKESNDPSKGMKSEHKAEAKQTTSDEGRGDHPAKQADPQQSPSKSTGVETEGPGTKAGEGKDPGVTKDADVLKPAARPK